ncbi:hypothetical protein ASF26_16550 [Methylobacterium sp. Leaf93]|nr:hypothetical protein ASF26_16550 [Methylobacterium sp. Leaf93]
MDGEFGLQGVHLRSAHADRGGEAVGGAPMRSATGRVKMNFLLSFRPVGGTRATAAGVFVPTFGTGSDAAGIRH